MDTFEGHRVLIHLSPIAHPDLESLIEASPLAWTGKVMQSFWVNLFRQQDNSQFTFLEPIVGANFQEGYDFEVDPAGTSGVLSLTLRTDG